ncbi:transmembrane protein 223 [Eublepharis macularius]|uniref:Transmembrane protein 223 n=1 Tax=Eublepharis macularius TaxID=481883 RepID=A0AA97JET5_EUBMA|nr:transmembrane protein 223 [Eublepharis macularius]
MLRCTWGSGGRIWRSGVGGSRGLGLFRSWCAPGAPCPVRSWSWGASRGHSAEKTPWRWEVAAAAAARGVHNSFPLDARVPRDVLLFQHERGRFFRILGLFCAGQFLFWAYLAHFAFHSLRDTGAKRPESDSQQGGRPLPTLPGGATLNLGSNKWRFGFTTSCLTVGSLILVAGYIFSRRSVSRVLLHRGGQEVTLTTYYPFGLTSSFTVPLRQISCMSHRSEVPAMIPLKIKGRPFYFLLDKQGRITNSNLFDITVGAYRKL